jgi:Fe-S cluster assembly protein SufB
MPHWIQLFSLTDHSVIFLCSLSNGAFYLFQNQAGTGQFERTQLQMQNEGSYVSRRLHRTESWRKPAACRSSGISRLDDAEIKYSTVQNWYPGNKEGKGGVFNFVTKEESVRKCKNLMDASRNGFCCHFEIYLKDNSVGEFYSIAVTNNFQQARNKMTHLGKILHQLLFLKEFLLDSLKIVIVV